MHLRAHADVIPPVAGQELAQTSSEAKLAVNGGQKSGELGFVPTPGVDVQHPHELDRPQGRSPIQRGLHGHLDVE